ncbi:MAG TPA: LPXTG cell wall anchor domain-containing protein [Pilimelia sp.]|nr:LPXTG cell wall anchor domain-containing protein [Pilimelia sp.]
MTSRLTRQLARLGVPMLLAGAGLGLAAGPAYAADSADLEVRLSGTRLAATASGKVFNVTLTNKGPGVASGVQVEFDLSELEQDNVRFEVPDNDACETEGTTVTCGVIDVKAGQSLDLGAVLTRVAGTGAAGSITVSVAHAGTDAVAGNNSTEATVSVGGSGADLYAYAPDVPVDPRTGRPGTVAPGGTASLHYEIGNQGDEAVDGIVLSIRLPGKVTFVQEEEGCEYNAAKTVATCTYEDLPIIPADDDTVEDDDNFSAWDFVNIVKVGSDAAAPSTLKGGVVTVEGLVNEETGPAIQRRAVANAPRNATGARAAEVDITDNSDEFSVYVALPSSGGGGGDGLPVTGAKAGVIGGVGLAVLLLGGAFLVLSRRRRVVLVAPGDERSAG